MHFGEQQGARRHPLTETIRWARDAYSYRWRELLNHRRFQKPDKSLVPVPGSGRSRDTVCGHSHPAWIQYSFSQIRLADLHSTFSLDCHHASGSVRTSRVGVRPQQYFIAAVTSMSTGGGWVGRKPLSDHSRTVRDSHPGVLRCVPEKAIHLSCLCSSFLEGRRYARSVRRDRDKNSLQDHAAGLRRTCLNSAGSSICSLLHQIFAHRAMQEILSLVECLEVTGCRRRKHKQERQPPERVQIQSDQYSQYNQCNDACGGKIQPLLAFHGLMLGMQTSLASSPCWREADLRFRSAKYTRSVVMIFILPQGRPFRRRMFFPCF